VPVLASLVRSSRFSLTRQGNQLPPGYVPKPAWTAVGRALLLAGFAWARNRRK
jgi:hypothetical protein